MNEPLFFIGFLALAVGIALVALGALLSTFRLRHRGEPGRSKTAGIVLIGPFPIIFGDKDLVKYSLALLLIFVAFSLILLFSSLRPT